MSASDNYPVTLHADAEHGGLRAAVLVLMVTAVFLSFTLINAFFEAVGAPDFAIFLSCAGAFPLGLLLVWFAERGLKQIWHSGRKITLTAQGVEAAERKSEPTQFHWGSHISMLLWQLGLSGYQRGGRERRLPANWVCLACQLTQGEERVVAYTFVSPRTAAKYAAQHAYHELDPADVYQKSTLLNRVGPPARPTIPAKVLSGPNGRFWVAEKRRWQDGFELSPIDFQTFVTAVAQHTKNQSA